MDYNEKKYIEKLEDRIEELEYTNKVYGIKLDNLARANYIIALLLVLYIILSASLFYIFK